jgi:hypothetical protein
LQDAVAVRAPYGVAAVGCKASDAHWEWTCELERIVVGVDGSDAAAAALGWLRKSYSHDPARFGEFTRRHRAELKDAKRSEAPDHLRTLAKRPEPHPAHGHKGARDQPSRGAGRDAAQMISDLENPAST